MNFFHKTILIAFAFFAAVLLCGREASAATEFISTIRATGGDYSLLSTWEAATQCDLTASTTVVYSGTGAGGISAGATLELFRNEEYQNITALKIATTSSQLLVQTFTGDYKVLQDGDQWRVASSTDNMWTVSSAGLGDSAIAVAECYNDWPTGLLNNVTISGWTTSADNYVKVYAPEGERHNGKAKDGAGNYTGFAIKQTVNYSFTLDVYPAYSRIDGLILDSNNKEYGSRYYGGFSVITNCISINATSGFWVRAGYVKVVNCVAYNNYRGFYVHSYKPATYFYNNTSISNGIGLFIAEQSGDAAGGLIKNFLASGNSTDFSLASSANTYYDLYNCASSDATADDWGGTGNRISQTFTFADETNDDFHLSSSDSGAKNQGADLSADAVYPITDDIDYQTRPYGGIWDIGADETPSSAFKFNGGTFKIRGRVKFE